MQVLFPLGFGMAITTLTYLLLAPGVFAPAARQTSPWSARLASLRAIAGRLATGVEPLGLELARIVPPRLAMARIALAAVATAMLLLVQLWWLLPLAVPLLALLPVRAVQSRLAGWRRQVRLELADAVEYLQLHFDTGATVPEAVDGACGFLTGPLAGELRRINARAALASPARALAEFAARISDPDADSLARRLASAWTRHAPCPDTFVGMGEALRRLRAAQIQARSRTLPVLYTLLIGWLLFAVAALVAPPALLSLLRGLGGSF